MLAAVPPQLPTPSAMMFVHPPSHLCPLRCHRNFPHHLPAVSATQCRPARHPPAPRLDVERPRRQPRRLTPGHTLRRRPARQPPNLILLSPGSRWCGSPLVSLSPASNPLSSPTQALPQHPSLGLHCLPLPRRCWLWCHMVPCLNRPHRWLWCQMVPCHNRPHRHQQRLDPARTLHLSPWPHRLQLDCRSEA